MLDHYLAVEALKTAKDIHAQNQTSWFYSSITEIFDYFKMKKKKQRWQKVWKYQKGNQMS